MAWEDQRDILCRECRQARGAKIMSFNAEEQKEMAVKPLLAARRLLGDAVKRWGLFQGSMHERPNGKFVRIEDAETLIASLMSALARAEEE